MADNCCTLKSSNLEETLISYGVLMFLCSRNDFDKGEWKSKNNKSGVSKGLPTFSSSVQVSVKWIFKKISGAHLPVFISAIQYEDNQQF